MFCAKIYKPSVPKNCAAALCFLSQVIGSEDHIKTCLIKIRYGLIKKLIVICLEPDLTLIFKETSVLDKLPCVGQPPFFMLSSRPGITEIYIYPVRLIFLAKALFNKGYIFNGNTYIVR
jgi:hypothetical protein